MAEVAEVVKDVEHITEKEKETEKKVIDLEDGKPDSKKESKPKENGKASESNEKSEPETNGNATTEVASSVTAAAKRKSGSADATDGSLPAEGTTPEKKPKISAEEADSKNGETKAAAPEVAATAAASVDGAGEAKNMSYQKH